MEGKDLLIPSSSLRSLSLSTLSYEDLPPSHSATTETRYLDDILVLGNDRGQCERAVKAQSTLEKHFTVMASILWITAQRDYKIDSVAAGLVKAAGKKNKPKQQKYEEIWHIVYAFQYLHEWETPGYQPTA